MLYFVIWCELGCALVCVGGCWFVVSFLVFGGWWVRVRRGSSINSSTNSDWCAKQLEAEQSGRCMQIPAALARIPHIHMFNASSPHFAIPLSLRIRLSQHHPAIVALRKSAYLPTTHSFPLSLHPPIHRHAPHSQRPAHRHLKHPRHQSIPCRHRHPPASSARVPGLPA